MADSTSKIIAIGNLGGGRRRITPFIARLQALGDEGRDVPIDLVYSTASPDTAFVDNIRQLARKGGRSVAPVAVAARWQADDRQALRHGSAVGNSRCLVLAARWAWAMGFARWLHGARPSSAALPSGTVRNAVIGLRRCLRIFVNPDENPGAPRWVVEFRFVQSDRRVITPVRMFSVAGSISCAR